MAKGNGRKAKDGPSDPTVDIFAQIRDNTEKIVAMLRVVDEIRELRDEKYGRLEDRLARLEKRVGLEE